MIGTDIIEICRVQKSAENPAFINGVFTKSEIEYYRAGGSKAQTLAGMFCAKEAAAKALGTGIRGFKLCEIEVCHTEYGMPYLKFGGKAQTAFLGKRAEVSISHCNDYATAVCILL